MKNKTRTMPRDARTGRIITIKKAKKNPKTTTVEKRKICK